MQITIHRGIDQIGGCITEISTDTTRIFVDMGDNLPGNGIVLTEDEKEKLVSGLFEQNKRDIEAVFYTHSHPDHTGMLQYVPMHVTQYMSKGTQGLLIKLEEVILSGMDMAEKAGESVSCSDLTSMMRMDLIKKCKTWERPARYRRPKTIVVGDIKVTPYFVSHSTYDANMLLIEADGKKILHTGDYREHGYLGKGLFPMLKKYVGQVDYLITEGTMLGQDNRCENERKISNRMFHVMQAFKYVFVLVSATDIERLAAINSATRMASRMLVACSKMHFETMDYFTGEADYKENSLFCFDYWKYSPSRESKKLIAKMRHDGFTMVMGAGHFDRAEQIKEHFDPSQTLLIYSSWDGYYKDPEQVRTNPRYKIFRDMFSNVVDLHTSGHADSRTVAKVIKTVNPREAIIGIHKNAGTSLTQLDLPEELKAKIVPDNNNPYNIKIK